MMLKGTKIEISEVLNINSVIEFILSLQQTSGDIPWHVGGKTDPWDLVETIMGLNTGKEFKASYR
ncbi:MAG: phenyltransferase domain-containing protein, partial [Proteobacteria bacterium]|nr:phenyltransferase domain-containing protein [Pseudomonadota bacterium]